MNLFKNMSSKQWLDLILFLGKLDVGYTYLKVGYAQSLIRSTGGKIDIPEGAIQLPIIDIAAHYLVPTKKRKSYE